MKILAFVFVWVIFGVLHQSILFAQEYTSMNFSEGVWIEEFFAKEGPEERIQKFCKGDSLIDDQMYFKLYESKILQTPPIYYPDTILNIFIGLIRNLPEKTVAYIPKGEVDPITIYDFNIIMGDSVQGEVDGFVVREIDSVEICGIYHKRYSEFVGSSYDENAIIEGIGFSNGLLGYKNEFTGIEEIYHKLVCYTEWKNQECSACEIIDGLDVTNIEFQLYPNPFTDHINIVSSKVINSLKVHDLMGKEIYVKYSLSDTYAYLELDHLISGYYLLRIQIDENRIHSLPIIKE